MSNAITPAVSAGNPTSAIPMSRSVRVELRKLIDTSAGRWLLIGLTAGCSVMVGLMVGTGNVEHLTFLNMFGMLLLPSTFLLPVLAILLVTSEWSQRTGMTTFTLEPRRTRVATAKLFTTAALVAGALLATAILATVATLLALALRPGVSGEWQLSADVFRNAILVQSARVLTAFGFAMLIRNSAAAIVAYFAVPSAWWVLGSAVPWLHEHVQPWADFSAATQVFTNGEAPFHSAAAVTGTQWAQLATAVLLWVGLPLALGLWRLLRAEVR